MVARWCAWGGSPVPPPGDNGQDHKGDEKGEGDEDVGHADASLATGPSCLVEHAKHNFTLGCDEAQASGP